MACTWIECCSSEMRRIGQVGQGFRHHIGISKKAGWIRTNVSNRKYKWRMISRSSVAVKAPRPRHLFFSAEASRDRVREPREHRRQMFPPKLTTYEGLSWVSAAPLSLHKGPRFKARTSHVLFVIPLFARTGPCMPLWCRGE